MYYSIILNDFTDLKNFSKQLLLVRVGTYGEGLLYIHVCNYTELPYRDHLFSGSSDNTIKMWNSQSLELLASFKGHDDPVCTLACSESFLFSGSLRSIKVQSIELYTRAFLSSCGRGAEGSSSQSVFADV